MPRVRGSLSKDAAASVTELALKTHPRSVVRGEQTWSELRRAEEQKAHHERLRRALYILAIVVVFVLVATAFTKVR